MTNDSFFTKATVLSLLILLIFSLHNAFVNVGYEGGWTLYAREISDGARLYKDIQYLLPPFYPTILSKIHHYLGGEYSLILFHLLIYLLVLISYYKAFISLGMSSNEALLGTSLVGYVPLLFSPFRFVDYHVLSILAVSVSCFSIASNRYILGYLAITCVVLTRPHDGIAIYVALFVSQVIMQRSWRLLYGTIPFLLVTLYFYSLDTLIGDGYNPSEGAAAKGINFYHIAARVAIGSSLSVIKIFYDKTLFFTAALLALAIFGKNFFPLSYRRIFGIIALGIIYVYPNYLTNIAPFGILIFSMFALKKIFILSESAYKKWICICLITFAYYASSFLSSAGRVSGMGMQSTSAFFLLYAWLGTDETAKKYFSQAIHRQVAAVLVCIVIVYKMIEPFQWHLYRSPPLLTGLTTYNGKVIRKDLALVYDQICPVISGNETLSLPFSNINYVCNVPLYKHNINSFFDIASQAHFDRLLTNLKIDPPRYIVYTRQMNNLKIHEALFNAWKPLPFRMIDEYIMNMIALGKWKHKCISIVSEGIFQSDECDSIYLEVITPDQKIVTIDKMKDVILLIDTDGN